MRLLTGALIEMRQGTTMSARRSGAERVEKYIREEEDLVLKLNCYSIIPDLKKKSAAPSDKITWNYVFDEVKDYFSKEADKATLAHSNKIFYLSLVKTVYEKATTSGPLLRWTKVLDFITSNLQKERVLSALGVELIAFLESFLQNEQYVSFIEGPSWSDIIQTLLWCRGKIDRRQLKLSLPLRCLKLCISRASEFEATVPTLRSKVVKFYMKTIQQDFSGVQDNVTIYLQGITELCNQNATEFRGILCTLGEIVIPKILQIQSFKEEEEAALIEFLMVQYALHMPYDCDMNSETFFAADNDAWKEILRIMYEYCTEIIEEKGRRTKPHDAKLTDKFLLLAAKCTKQISCPLMTENDNDDYEEIGILSKKKMRYKAFHTIVSEISRKPVNEGMLVWMDYFTRVLTTFPEMIENKSNLSNLLHFGSSFFNTRYMLRREFFQFFSSLLDAEKYLWKQNVLQGPSDTWPNIWDLTIRSLSVCEGKAEAVNLLRKLLREIRPTNITPLLMMYVNGTMPLVEASLHLLSEYLTLTTLPIQLKDSGFASQSIVLDDSIAFSTCPRIALARWILKMVNVCATCSEKLVATLLCSLIVKQTESVLMQEFEKPPGSVKIHRDFERKLFKLSFVKESEFVEEEPKSAVTKQAIVVEGTDLIYLANVAERLADALQVNFDNSHQDGLEKLYRKVIVCINVFNLIEKYSIGEGTSPGSIGFKAVVSRLFDNGMNQCSQLILAKLTNPDVPGQQPNVITNLLASSRKLLVTTKLSDKMRQLVCQKLDVQVLELVKRVFRCQLPRYIRGSMIHNDGGIAYHAENLESNIRLLESEPLDKPEELYLMTSPDPKYEKMSLTALEFLLDFGSCHQKLDLFVELLRDLMAERAVCAHLYLFNAMHLLISRVTELEKSMGMQDLLQLTVELIQKMCRAYYMNSDCCAKMWNLFRDLTPHIASHGGVISERFMILFGTAFKLLRDKNGKLENRNTKLLLRNVFQALSALSKNDPGLTWSVFTASQQQFWILEEVHIFFAHACHEVRQAVTDMICVMYENASPFDYTEGIIIESQDHEMMDATSLTYQNRRKDFLDKLYEALIHQLLTVESDLSEEETTEESVNRTILALACVTRLIFAFPYTQKQTIMQLITIVKAKKMDIDLVSRALEYASKSAHQTLCSHLSYILKRIMKLNMYTFDQLPHQFFGFEIRKEFFKKFRNVITVEYFEQGRIQELKDCADEAALTLDGLIQASCGVIMARLLPGLHGSRLNIEKSTEIQRRLYSSLGGKEICDRLMFSSISDVIINLISLIFEPAIGAKWNCEGIKMVEPVPPYHSEDTIANCLKYLENLIPHENVSVVGILARTSPASLYMIMLNLITRVHEAHNYLEKFWRIHHFSFFINTLLEEPPEIFELMKEYVCNFAFNAYLRLLAGESGKKMEKESVQFSKVLLKLVCILVQQISEIYPSLMEVHFVPLVRGVVAKILHSPSLFEDSKPLLDYLLIQKKDIFTNQIVSLDPFPSTIADFKAYGEVHLELKYGTRRSDWLLSKELEHFLTGSEFECEPTKERLIFLRDLLSQGKRDLDRLVRNLENRQFSEECEEDPLHKIIQMLTTLSVSSSDEFLVIEACKCLGEIGPVDLSVLVLPSCNNGQPKVTKNDDAVNAILETLSRYLSSSDIRLVTAAGEVLQSYLAFSLPASAATSEYADQRFKKLLMPFFQKERISSVEKVEVNTLENNLALNEMDEQISYRNWLTQLTIGIIECFKKESSMLSTLLPLCHLRLDFCEAIFPYVVYMCLQGGRPNPIVKKIMSNYFRGFFTKFLSNFNSITDALRSVTPSSSGSSTTVIYMNKLALRSMLRAIQFLRRHDVPQEGSTKPTPFDNNFWIELNYLDVARAAQYCGAYLTSILYVEIAATELERTRIVHYKDDFCEDDGNENFFSQGGVTYPKNRSEALRMEKLLLTAYAKIGEVDAVFGCGSARLLDGATYHLDHIMDGQKLLTMANGSSINKDSCSEYQTALAMKYLGTYNVLWTYLKGAECQGVLPEDLQQAQYECGWRLSQWDLNTDKPAYIKEFTDVPAHAAFQMSIYDGIHALTLKDKQYHNSAIANGYRSVHNELCHATLESSTNLYGFLSRLQMLRVVEDAWGSHEPNEMDIQQFISKWKAQDKIPVAEYKYHEPTLFVRNVILRVHESVNPSENLESEIIQSLLTLSAKAREASQLNYAEGCTQALASICKRPLLAREFEVAKNTWERGAGETRELKHMRQDALTIMSHLIKKSSHDDELYPALLLKYGEWLSESHCERPTVILEKFMKKACTLFEKRSNSGNGSQADVSNSHTVLAKYADAQFQNVTKYISSEVFQLKKKHVELAEADRKSFAGMNHQNAKAATIMQRHTNNDTDEIGRIYAEQTKFLQLALTHYLKGLRTSSEHDLLIFRAISLWLENGHENGEDQQTTQIFVDEELPSHKYVPVLHQLSARLNNKPSTKNAALRNILRKCAEDHPYHTLPVLLTQASLHKDENLPVKKSQSPKILLAGRVQAAAEIVASLKKNPRLSKLVSRMEVMWLALIQLANINDRSNAEGVTKCIPDHIMKDLQNLETIPVPTSHMPVLSSMNYKDHAVAIVNFSSNYGLVGGINSPKKIQCRGRNGMKYNMLLKGQDDLRQDAVMQQVFGVMNQLLQAEHATNVRRLCIRTYKVIPLSQRTGLIEWVENTTTLGEYLTGGNRPDKGAHSRYRPNDYSAMDCRRKLNEARPREADAKLAIYMNICENFKPVFRHFFFENFTEAGTFFERRLAYTRSVATNSIVGYILGLGDRHVLNILVDKTTAELIHIDLGVAFEQGRILPTPETIPFRLSRDIIDGMGISGPEGVFRRCAEMTMEVLRNNMEIILTVLQVLLYDPLYMWTLSSDRVARVQPSDTTKGGRKAKNSDDSTEESVNERNNSASRVLLRLRQKLMGIEEEGGQTGAISAGATINVPGHVSLLISRAIDPEKLCRLFPGWQPYL